MNRPLCLGGPMCIQNDVTAASHMAVPLQARTAAADAGVVVLASNKLRILHESLCVRMCDRSQFVNVEHFVCRTRCSAATCPCWCSRSSTSRWLRPPSSRCALDLDLSIEFACCVSPADSSPEGSCRSLKAVVATPGCSKGSKRRF